MSKQPGLQELQVRLAAQAVLTRRLLPEMAPQTDHDDSSPAGAADLLIDLTGATLVGISLAHRRLRDVRFTYANFHEVVSFSGAAFADTAWFRRAAFHGPVWFHETQFQDGVMFANAKFVGWPTLSASFDRAHFHERAVFVGAEFKNGALFKGSTFHNGANFSDIRCEDYADFQGVTFEELAFFDRASFAKPPYFDSRDNIRGKPTVAGERRNWPEDL